MPPPIKVMSGPHIPFDWYRFVNRDGKEIYLRGDMTIEDMVRAGIDGPKFIEPGTPFESPREYRFRCSA